VAKPELGSKRQCQACATKFYDFHRAPIVCPKCGTVFHAEPLARTVARPSVEESEENKDDAEVVSLSDVEENENKSASVEIDDDVEIDDSEDEDDTFLEQEEGEDDDVADLIDGDIDTDEEA